MMSDDPDVARANSQMRRDTKERRQLRAAGKDPRPDRTTASRLAAVLTASGTENPGDLAKAPGLPQTAEAGAGFPPPRAQGENFSKGPSKKRAARSGKSSGGTGGGGEKISGESLGMPPGGMGIGDRINPEDGRPMHRGDYSMKQLPDGRWEVK